MGAGAAAGGSSGRWLSQVELGEALARRCGFRLELGPSSVPHPEAGGLALGRRAGWRSGVVRVWSGVRVCKGVSMLTGRLGPWWDKCTPVLGSCGYQKGLPVQPILPDP